jgi:hypothetical protein
VSSKDLRQGTGNANDGGACRLYWALATCTREQLHAEKLVASVLEHHRLSASPLPFYFFRVRSNGLLAGKDFQPKWQSFKIPTCDASMLESFVRRQRQADADAAQAGGAVALGGGRRAAAIAAPAHRTAADVQRLAQDVGAQ